MKTFKAKPLITNPTPPAEIFTTDELELIKATVERYGKITYGQRVQSVSQKEQATVANLLRQARFQGYYPSGVNLHGHLKWGCVAQSGFNAIKIVITIVSCGECSANFHAFHYQDEQPDTICDDCAKLAKSRVTPPRLKEVPGAELSAREKEARIAKLRRQGDKLTE